MRRSIFRPMLLGASVAVPLLLAGCGGDEGVPQSFPPLRYNYLAPISLNVANIRTDVRYVPVQGGSNLDAMSPEAPLQALEQLVQDRLVAGGAGGTAVVTINAASLNQVNDTVVGNISLRLTVTSADGRQRGFTDANVTRTRTMPDNTSPDALRAFLYSMTQDLVSAENVELEYQIRQNLPGWLVGGGSAVIGGPAAPTPVQAVPLGGPGSAPMVAPMTAPATGSVVPMPSTLGASDGSTPDTATMPGGSLGIPEGNPVPTDEGTAPPATTSAVPGAPMPLTPAVPASMPAAGTPVGTSGNTSYQLVPAQPSTTGAPTAPAAAVPTTTTTTTTTTKPAAASSSGSLPPLPAGITP